MPKGSCMCGEFTYEIPNAPDSIVVCHCIPCRKAAGHNGSCNAVIPPNEFKQLSGKTRHFERTGDSGNNVRYTFCDNCNTPMTVEAAVMPNLLIIKPGTLDDQEILNKAKVVQEVYTKNRTDCFAALGVAEKETQ